ncbi:hypothetical protein CERZMDRAFT_89765 [Cercospora zeae-maydis SCOH1-5]|uniref:Uncharacterized protein n=1 Tax=Cercospora zeae-maydis SCOH1-5 TaxID=717836 RepID=A0A6A6FV24_9PEZI|nr:hypothetical protein CERZMDRAFT_89765 [Cercospora zeae-maydis SCOH1-5]
MPIRRQRHYCYLWHSLAAQHAVKANRSRAPASQSGSPLSCTLESYQHRSDIYSLSSQQSQFALHISLPCRRYCTTRLRAGLEKVSVRPEGLRQTLRAISAKVTGERLRV